VVKMGASSEAYIQEHNDFLYVISFLEDDIHHNIPGVSEVVGNLKAEFETLFGEDGAPWLK